MDICNAGSLDMKFILDLYQTAFPPEERKPFSLIERKVSMGEMEILLIREEGKPVGFAITALGERIVLLDYFAVVEKERNHGYGADALELLRELYRNCQFFLEIEEPDEAAADNSLRMRRKAFYLRNGMLETGIRVELFGVKMELLSSKPGLRYEECESVYRMLMGSMYQRFVKRLS